jgi:excisionase family DNA binding protein
VASDGAAPERIELNGVEYVRADLASPERAAGRWLRVTEVAEMAGCSCQSVRRAIDRGALPARVPSGLKRGWRVSERDARAWLAGR